jgi:hypothetical protein
MGPHLDVIGYLLAGIVFSVSLLVSRTQAATSAAIQNAVETSWRLRDAIHGPDYLNIQDVTMALAVADREPDPARNLTRIVNLGLYMAIAVAFGDAVRLLSEGAPRPTDALLLSCLMVGAATLVFALGEFHHRYEMLRAKREINETLVGLLWRLDWALREDHPTAAIIVSSLRRQYPMWSMLQDFECISEYLSGNFEGAIAIGERVIISGAPTYHAPLLVTASAIRLQVPHRAVEILEIAQSGTYHPSYDVLAQRAGLLAANLDSLVAVAAFDPNAPRLEERDSGVVRAIVHVGPRTSALNPQWQQLEPLLLADEMYGCWHADGAMPIDPMLVGMPMSLLWQAFDGVHFDKDKLERFRTNCVRTSNSYGLETVALIELALPTPETSLGCLEQGCQIRPSSSRLHFLRGVALGRRAWSDKARQAFSTSEQLGGLDPLIYHLARQKTTIYRSPSIDVGDVLLDPPRRIESILLASTLGIDMTAKLALPLTNSSRFLTALCRANIDAHSLMGAE